MATVSNTNNVSQIKQGIGVGLIFYEEYLKLFLKPW